MYCNASSTAFPAVRCFQFRKNVVGLSATLYRSSDRTVQHFCLRPESEHERQLCEEFAPQPEGTNGNDTHVCKPICINMYFRAKHNNQEKNYPFIEGRSDKNFRVVNLFTGSIFAIILFYTVMYSVHRHGHHCRSSPLGEVRILCRTGTRAHFAVINKGAG